MIDQQIKKKIVNTISKYEEKCEAMQIEINTLRNAIAKLINLQTDFPEDIQQQFLLLREGLISNEESQEILHQVELIESKIINVEKPTTTELDLPVVQQGTQLLIDFANKLNNYSNLSQLELFQKNLGIHGQKSKEFIQLMKLCLTEAIEQYLGKVQQFEPSDIQSEPLHLIVSKNVNQSLQQLLDNLTIPQTLSGKVDTLKGMLQKQITEELLPQIIDVLTGLLVDIFSVEQNQFKNFLQSLTNQLHDFDNYLKFSTEQNTQSRDNCNVLEIGIQSNIKEIRNHVDTSTTIEDLSNKINLNLSIISDKFKEFKQNEKTRFDAYEVEVKQLQDKLLQSERAADEFRNMLSFQKVKINQDSLTGLPNRAAYDEIILKAYERWGRGYGNLSLAIADIDHFKAINDNFGHLAGDKVLKKIALIFKESIRSIDFIARYGGEEFVFVFENTSVSDAQNILEALRKSVEGCLFSYRDNKVDVTVSFGLTALTADDDLESLFIRADSAMYSAKNAGRNRVVCI